MKKGDADKEQPCYKKGEWEEFKLWFPFMWKEDLASTHTHTHTLHRPTHKYNLFLTCTVCVLLYLTTLLLHRALVWMDGVFTVTFTLHYVPMLNSVQFAACNTSLNKLKMPGGKAWNKDTFCSTATMCNRYSILYIQRALCHMPASINSDNSQG